MRIYSNYSEEEYKILKQKSEEIGMSLSQFQKYYTLLSLSKVNLFIMKELQEKIEKGIENAKVGDVFIVSTFISEEWVSLNHSQKTTLSQFLSKKEKNNPDIKKNKKINNIWQYIKIKISDKQSNID